MCMCMGVCVYACGVCVCGGLRPSQLNVSILCEVRACGCVDGCV